MSGMFFETVYWHLNFSKYKAAFTVEYTRLGRSVAYLNIRIMCLIHISAREKILTEL